MQRLHAVLAMGPLLAVGSFLALSVAVPAFSADTPPDSTGSVGAAPTPASGAAAPTPVTTPTPVPEPSTSLMLAMGLVGLGLRGGRRRTAPWTRTALVAGSAVLLFGASPATALDARAREACAFWAASDGSARKQMMQRYAEQMAQQDPQLGTCIYLQWDRFTAALDRACYDGSDLDRSLAQVYTQLTRSGDCE